LSLRQAQRDLTRERICKAAAELLGSDGDPGAITFKAVAERAVVTEMTVYRHFPNREALLRGIWEHLNAQMDPGIGMPGSLSELRGQHDRLFSGFDRIAPQIIAAIATPQGREMRASLNKERQEAFLAIVSEAAPQLDRKRKRQVAALLQLLHSAYAWASLREQWDLTGLEAAQATRWLIELILKNSKEPMK
jgi:AcrR family transcriptional regulator